MIPNIRFSKNKEDQYSQPNSEAKLVSLVKDRDTSPSNLQSLRCPVDS